MPRNRQEIDRDAKVDEILRVAEQAIRSGGYDSLTFNGIANELGVARGAVYWYFKTKDDLLVAVAAGAFAAALSDPPTRGDYVRRITWAVERLADLQPLTAALHERAPHSESAARFEEAVQEELCRRLRDLLRPHVVDSRLEDVAQAIVVFVQGLLTMPLAARDRDRRVRFLVRALVES